MADKVLVYQDSKGEWRWSRSAANGEVLADSGEGYVNKADCLETARRVNTDEDLVWIGTV